MILVVDNRRNVEVIKGKLADDVEYSSAE